MMKLNVQHVLKTILLPLLIVGALLVPMLTFAPSAQAAPLRLAHFDARDNCARATGTVISSGHDIALRGRIVGAHCTGKSYLYLSYYHGGYHYNNWIAVVGNGEKHGVHFSNNERDSIDRVALTMCSTSGGWHCGHPSRG